MVGNNLGQSITIAQYIATQYEHHTDVSAGPLLWCNVTRVAVLVLVLLTLFPVPVSKTVPVCKLLGGRGCRLTRGGGWMLGYFFTIANILCFRALPNLDPSFLSGVW